MSKLIIKVINVSEYVIYCSDHYNDIFLQSGIQWNKV
jgi:hypothetical protein